MQSLLSGFSVGIGKKHSSAAIYVVMLVAIYEVITAKIAALVSICDKANPTRSHCALSPSQLSLAVMFASCSIHSYQWPSSFAIQGKRWVANHPKITCYQWRPGLWQTTIIPFKTKQRKPKRWISPGNKAFKAYSSCDLRFHLNFHCLTSGMTILRLSSRIHPLSWEVSSSCTVRLASRYWPRAAYTRSTQKEDLLRRPQLPCRFSSSMPVRI